MLRLAPEVRIRGAPAMAVVAIQETRGPRLA